MRRAERELLVLDARVGVGPRKEQSHGESFLALLDHRFGPNGLYILDEPEAALSPSRQLTLLKRMHDLVEGGTQMIIASDDRERYVSRLLSS